MPRRAVIALGIGQCVNWGVLYYAFAVLLVPVEQDLGVARWIVAGAFSCGLLMSALLAPNVGAWIDRGDGPRVMLCGGLIASVLLGLWSFAPNLVTTYVVWMGIGACMAATLYEPAFGIIARAHSDDRERFRSLATVTVFGGLASTLFLPLADALVRVFGWRGAVAVLAALLAASTCVTWIAALRPLEAVQAPGPLREDTDQDVGLPRLHTLTILLAVFSVVSLVSAGFTTNLIPALATRGFSADAAAALGGLLGVMQLPGRVLVMNRKFATAAIELLSVSLGLQSLGFLLLAGGGSGFAVPTAVAIFAMGAGLTTLARPQLVQTLFTVPRAGYLNGRIARAQQIGRACGPVSIAWLGGVVGFTYVFATLGVTFVGLVLLSRAWLRPFEELFVSLSNPRSCGSSEEMDRGKQQSVA